LFFLFIDFEFYARLGGIVPFPDEILAEIQRMASTKLTTTMHPRDAWLARFTAQEGS